MTVAELNRFPEEQVIKGKDLNRFADAFLGNDGMRRIWHGFDGTIKDVNTGTTTTTGAYADSIKTTHGKHFSVQHSAGTADTPANQVFAVDDDFALIGRGKELRFYNTAGSNFAAFYHSGTNDVLKTDDSLQIATALNVGSSIVATGAGDASIQGALTVTGVATFNGNTQIGNADTDTLTVIGVTTFRNAASSATQMYVDAANNRVIVGGSAPLTTATDDRFTVVGGTSYFAGNSGPSIGIRYNASQTVGWTVSVDGAGANKDLLFLDDGAAEILRVGDTSSTYQVKVTGDFNVTDHAVVNRTLTTLESVYIGDTANANVTLGLTINQGTADDVALSLKSADVSHGMTAFTEDDTYAELFKVSGAIGGVTLRGITEGTIAINLAGRSTTDDTTRSTAAVGHVIVDGATKSGTSVAAPGANANLFVVRAAGAARFLVDQEGDIHMDATSNINAWDDEPEDVALLEAYRLTTMREEPRNFRRLFSDNIARHAETLARTGVITMNADGHHFVSMKALNGLMIDSIRQVYGRLLETQHTVDVLQRRLMVLEGQAHELSSP